MKKLSLLICLMIVICSSYCIAFAENNVKIIDFEFTVNGVTGNEISAGDTIGASLKLINPSDKPQDYAAVLQVVKYGRILLSDVECGRISETDGEKEIILDAGTVGTDIDKCEITFQLVSDFETYTPLAPKGTFRCSDSRIAGITLEKTKFFFEDSSVYNEENPMLFPIRLWAYELPVDMIIEPVDLTTKITYNDIGSESGKLTVNSVAHDGTESVFAGDVILDIPQNNQLSGIYINGSPVEGFSKDKYEYIVSGSEEGIPEVTVEKVDENAEVNITYPDALPGKAEISVAFGEETKTYNLIFTKSVEAPLLYVGSSLVRTNGFNLYGADELNDSLKLAISYTGNINDYANRRVYLKFDESVIPGGAKLAGGTLKTYLKNYKEGMDTKVEFYTVADKDWYENPSAYAAIGNWAKETDTLIHTNIPGSITSTEFKEFTYELSKELYSEGTDGFNIVARQSPVSSAHNIFISVADGQLPVLSVQYYFE